MRINPVGAAFPAVPIKVQCMRFISATQVPGYCANSPCRRPRKRIRPWSCVTAAIRRGCSHRPPASTCVCPTCRASHARHEARRWPGTSCSAGKATRRPRLAYPAARGGDEPRSRRAYAGHLLAAVAACDRTGGAGRGGRAPAGLVASQMLGFAFCRYVLALPAVAAMDCEAVVASLGPPLQRYLTEPRL